MVLAGPANGDDHFYVVNLANDFWKEDAKYIDGYGVLGAVRETLEDLENDIDTFTGTVAATGKPIYYINYFRTYLGWPMTPANIESYGSHGLKEKSSVTATNSQNSLVDWHDHRAGHDLNWRPDNAANLVDEL